jgi:hypothetical protein
MWRMLDPTPRIKARRGVPMEEKRLQVAPEQITAHFAHRFEFVQGVPAHFVFNMDEIDHQEWADKQSKIWF